jgi:hypothetical protein
MQEITRVITSGPRRRYRRCDARPDAGLDAAAAVMALVDTL